MTKIILKPTTTYNTYILIYLCIGLLVSSYIYILLRADFPRSGVLIAALFYILMLFAGFYLARRKNPTSQIELNDGKLTISNHKRSPQTFNLKEVRSIRLQSRPAKVHKVGFYEHRFLHLNMHSGQSYTFSLDGFNQDTIHNLSNYLSFLILKS